MSLNIKNEEANELVHKLALLTGESLTLAVTVAVRERLVRLETQSSLRMSDKLLAIGRDCAPRLVDLPDHGDFLYGEDGLPK